MNCYTCNKIETNTKRLDIPQHLKSFKTLSKVKAWKGSTFTG